MLKTKALATSLCIEIWVCRLRKRQNQQAALKWNAWWTKTRSDVEQSCLHTDLCMRFFIWPTEKKKKKKTSSTQQTEWCLKAAFTLAQPVEPIKGTHKVKGTDLAWLRQVLRSARLPLSVWATQKTRHHVGLKNICIYKKWDSCVSSYGICYLYNQN